MISTYWVGQIPKQPLLLRVWQNGAPLDLDQYDTVEARLLDGDDRRVDLTGSVLDVQNAGAGRLLFHWPTNKSLFERPGQYVMQLILRGSDALDFTGAVTIFVKALGRLTTDVRN